MQTLDRCQCVKKTVWKKIEVNFELAVLWCYCVDSEAAVHW